MRSRPDEKLLRDVVEAMTTNESFFFRDTKPFDQLRTLVLPRMLKNRAQARHLRIWCAACSSGQEPYSIAMILSEEAAKLAGWRVDILATDLSNEILRRAKEGAYSQFEVQRGLPITMLMKYFEQNGDRWQISQKIRDMVTFRPFNLLNDPAPLGRFDIVFCRNVLIYFEHPTKAKVLAGIARQMPNDGILYLGGAETVIGLSEHFQLIEGQRGIYAAATGGMAAQSIGAPARLAVG
jgi:chemotaxis protein methyltransferase CheR